MSYSRLTQLQIVVLPYDTISIFFFSIRRYTADDHIYGVARPANQSARILFHTHLPQYGKLLNIACPTGIQIRNSKLDLDMIH